MKRARRGGPFCLLWKKALPKRRANYLFFLRVAFFFLAFRFVAFFFVLRLATFFLAFFLVAFFFVARFFATLRFGAALFFVTFRFFAPLRLEVFFLDFFLVAIIFLRVGYPALSIYNKIKKSSELADTSWHSKFAEL